MKTYRNVHAAADAPCASYLFEPLFRMEHALDAAINALRRGFKPKAIDPIPAHLAVVEQKPIEFDTVACSGISGIVFGIALAQRTGKKIAIVRKDGDGTHSAHKVEANCFAEEIGNYVIVDDLVDTGKTVQRIVQAVREHDLTFKCKHVATYLYDSEYLRRP